MPKNILVITGSPRKDSNSDMMANSFIRGARANGHTVTKFEAAKEKITGCIACDTCWSKGTACTFSDGFTELEPLLEAADVIVFASPLYWFGMSSQIKAAIDKLNAYSVDWCKRPLKIKESILLICGALNEQDMFTGIIETYKSMGKFMNWEDKGVLTIPSVLAKGDITKADALIKAENLGKAI